MIEEKNFSSIAKQPRKKKNIQRDLADVYTNGDGEVPDLTKLDKSERPIWKKTIYILIAVFAVLVAVGLTGFFVFSNFSRDNFTNEKITLKIEPPITLVSGQESVFTVMITNKEKINLYNVKLELFYPDNFKYVSASPEAAGDQKDVWEFSVLKVGETQKIELTAEAIAAVNSVLTLKGELTFKPANLNATFKQEAIIDAVVASSVIGLEVTGPAKTLANQPAAYVLKYKNSSQKEFSDLEVVADYPEGFVFASSTPEAKEGTNNIWSLAKLATTTDGEIKISGNYSAIKDGGNYDFKARIQLKQNGDYYPQAEASLTTEVVKDQLFLQLIVNGSAEDQPINFGDLLVYTLTYKNTGEEELKNIEITANLNSSILDWSTLKDAQKGLVKQNTIVWTGRQIAKLLKLGPAEEGTISWQIRVKDASAAGNQAVSKFSVESQMAAKSQQAAAGTESTVKSKTIVNSINSDLGLTAQARYYDEDNAPLGAGPVQPKVGETSTYNIKVNLSNNLHEMRDVRATITLPKTVTWADKENHSAGDFVYDAGSHKITWLISRLAKSANNTEATFNVSLKPQESEAGRVLVLVSEINVTAKDVTTGADVQKSLKAITTAFNDPILGQLNGVAE